MKNFLVKYIDHSIPDESKLRKNYSDDCYSWRIKITRENIAKYNVWICEDEITIYYKFNITKIWWELNDKATLIMLLPKTINEINYATVSRFVNSALKILLLNGSEEKVFLLITDAAQCMIKAGKKLKLFNADMIHVTHVGA